MGIVSLHQVFFHIGAAFFLIYLWMENKPNKNA